MDPLVLGQVTTPKVVARQFGQIGIGMDNCSGAGRQAEYDRRQRNLRIVVEDTVPGGYASGLKVVQDRAKHHVPAEGAQILAPFAEQGQHCTVIRRITAALPAAVRRTTITVLGRVLVAHMDHVQATDSHTQYQLAVHC